MWQQYLRSILRNWAKYGRFTSLQLLGLTVSFTAIGLIVSYVQHETHFESFHTKAHRIIRATYQFQSGGGFEAHWARIPVDYINELPTDVPGIEAMIRFQNQERKYLRIGEDTYRPKHTYLTDSNVFEVFDFQLIAGDPATALSLPQSVVLTEELATTYFGTTDAIGKEIQVNGDWQEEEVTYQVRGVMENLPPNTHLPVDLLLSFNRPEDRRGWAYVYLLLAEGLSMHQIAEQLPAFVEQHTQLQEGQQVDFPLQALPDIHLTSQLAREIVPNGNPFYPKLFTGVGWFLLLIALFNSVNLQVALSLKRRAEMGVRQLLGAQKGGLLAYLLGDTTLLGLLAASVAIGLVALLKPGFEQMVESPLIIHWGQMIGLMLGLGVLTGIISNLYPSFLLSSKSPISLFRSASGVSSTGKGLSLRSVLLGVQFFVCILLVSCTLVAGWQMRYLQTKDLGYEREQLLAIPGIPQSVRTEHEVFLQRVSQISGVNQTGACMEVPSREIRDSGPVLIQGVNQDPNQAPMMDMQVVSHSYLELMGITLAEGENQLGKYLREPPELSESYTMVDYFAEEPRTYLINETAMRKLGWQTPKEAIGQSINWSISQFTLAYGPITGVVKDFHQETLKNTIDPLVITYEPIWLGTLLFKLESSNSSKILAEMKEIWQDMFPGFPMEYQFVDELYHQLYTQERIQFQLLMVCSGLALFIAFLGLFALVSWSMQHRKKELALRLIMGASPRKLLQLLSKEYLLMLAIGTIPAVALAIYGLREWLANFAYQISLSPLWFVLSVALVVSLVLVTVRILLRKVANQVPMEALREE
ncbi:MAG: FtsX-like permease family protein [Bacteroidota bacterium]